MLPVQSDLVLDETSSQKEQIPSVKTGSHEQQLEGHMKASLGGFPDKLEMT